MNLGFVVNNLGNSELNYDLLKEINSRPEISQCIFFQNHMPSILIPECLTMGVYGLSNFKGVAVAFDLQSASIISQTNCKTKNYLYLYNIEWLYASINYQAAIELLKNFTIFARSESHKKIIENYCGQEVKVVKSIKGLIECLK
jgi:hypothetical protein